MFRANALFLLATVSAYSQVTSIPAGGGGSITSGRVAFGDGTSTAATDSKFVWDNTNKRFQLGDNLSGSYSGYEPYVKTSEFWENTTNYPTYQDIYSHVIEYKYGSPTMGVTAADLYNTVISSRITGNTDTTAEVTGVYGISQYTTVEDTAKVGIALGLYSSAIANSGTTADELTAAKFFTNSVSGSTVTKAYILRLLSGGSGPTEKWALSSESSWPSRILGKVAVGESNLSTPTNTLYVKDATATTGSTSVQFDIGAGQSSTSTILTLGGVIRFNGQNTTGAGSAALGSNSPAVTNTAPYTWIRAVSSDGSTVYIPAWK